ncbi:MAG TPA: hypothetical protein VNH11_11545 [Pirellulales bacterium]|nr:hypothetical protein [Pirellulales bacterium]
MPRFLDGGHDRAGMLAGPLDLVQDGTLVIHDDGRPLPGGRRAQTLLTEAVDANLPVLARLAFFIA